MARKPAPTTKMMIRSVPRDVARAMTTGAAARGLTNAQYLAALLALHEALRSGEEARSALKRLGLEAVTA